MTIPSESLGLVPPEQIVSEDHLIQELHASVSRLNQLLRRGATQFKLRPEVDIQDVEYATTSNGIPIRVITMTSIYKRVR